MTNPTPATRRVAEHGELIGVTVYFDAEAVGAGWSGDVEELRLSVAAACHEVIGDDGMPYQPIGTAVVTPPEPEGLPLHQRRAYLASLAEAEDAEPDGTLPAE